MDYDMLLGTVERFCNQALGGVRTKLIDTPAGTGKLIYARNGDIRYGTVLSSLFGVENAYKEWDSDFVLFNLNGTYLAAGTYTLDSAAEEEDEVKEFTNVLLTELGNIME